MIQKSLIILKPDGMRPEVQTAIEAKLKEHNLTLLKSIEKQMTKAETEELYAEHKGKSFFESYTTYMSSAPVRIMAIKGEEAISVIRGFLGATKPKEAEPGTIRRDFKLDEVIHPELGVIRNTAHASSAPDDAIRELKVFFADDVLEA